MRCWSPAARLGSQGTRGDRRAELRVRERSVMGVIVPLVEVDAAAASRPSSAPDWDAAGCRHHRRRLRELLAHLVRLAENEVACRRLAAELRKTQRKVNALEHIFLPEYRETITRSKPFWTSASAKRSSF